MTSHLSRHIPGGAGRVHSLAKTQQSLAVAFQQQFVTNKEKQDKETRGALRVGRPSPRPR